MGNGLTSLGNRWAALLYPPYWLGAEKVELTPPGTSWGGIPLGAGVEPQLG